MTDLFKNMLFLFSHQSKIIDKIKQNNKVMTA